jgi:hypothetical protein
LNKDLNLKDLLFIMAFPYILACYTLLCTAYSIFYLVSWPIQRLIEKLKVLSLRQPRVHSG